MAVSPQGLSEAAELERQGDAAEGRDRATLCYQQAQRALLPPGVQWSDRAEYDARMLAFSRIQEKLYGVGERFAIIAQPTPEPEAPTPASPPPGEGSAASADGQRQRDAAEEGIRRCVGAEWEPYLQHGLDGLSDAQFEECLREIGRWHGDPLFAWVEQQALGCAAAPRRRALLELCLADLQGYLASATSGGEGLARQEEVGPEVRRLEALLRKVPR